jgi:ankyrin repeat protein
MSDATPNSPEPDAGASPAAGAPDQLPVDLAQMFDLARAGADLLLEFVDAGVSPDLTDASGNSLLMLAAYHGHAGLVTGLAQRGADVDRLNARGQSPLAGAVFKRYDDVVTALLAAGADPDAGAPSARATAQMFGSELPGA